MYRGKHLFPHEYNRVWRYGAMVDYTDKRFPCETRVLDLPME